MATPLRPAFDLLVQYAGYHRDRRNILTHFVGIPMIVFAIGVLLARAGFEVSGVPLSAAWVLFGLTAAWYLTRGELALGLATVACIALLMALAHPLARGSAVNWLACGLGFFVVGWIVQFLGHYYEGRKPAFADDLVGLLVGPMFVVLELGAMAGLFKALAQRVEDRAGPTVQRDLAHPA